MHTVPFYDKSITEPGKYPGGAALRLVLFFTLVLYLSPQSYLPFLEPLHLAMVSAVLALGAFFLVKAPPLAMTRPEQLVLALSCIALVSIPFSSWPGGSFSYFFDIYLKVLIIYFLMSRVLLAEEHIRTMFVIIVWCNTFFALTGIWHYANGIYLKGDRIGGPMGGIAADPNDLALSLVCTLSLAVFLAKTSPEFYKKSFYWFCTIAMIIGVYVSYSRGGFLGLLAVLFFLYLDLPRQRKPAMLFFTLMILAVTIVVTSSSYFSRMSTIVHTEKDELGTATVRWNDMRDSARSALANPLLGAGLGMNTLALKEVRGDTSRGGVHSAPLEVLSELGIPALAVYLALTIALFKTLFRLKQWSEDEKSEPSQRQSMASALYIALWGFFVAGFFLPVAYRWYFYYLAGMATALIRMDLSLREPEEIQPIGTFLDRAKNYRA